MTIRDDSDAERTLTPMDEIDAESPVDEDLMLLRELLPEDQNERRKAVSALLRALLASSSEA